MRIRENDRHSGPLGQRDEGPAEFLGGFDLVFGGLLLLRPDDFLRHIGGRTSCRQPTLILRGLAFSAFGSTRVITPSFMSAAIFPCSIVLEIWKLRA